MKESLPESIGIQGEITKIVQGNPDSFTESYRVRLYIEDQLNPFYEQIWDGVPSLSNLGSPSERQHIDLTFQECIKKGNFDAIKRKEFREVLELYRAEKVAGRAWRELTYCLRHDLSSAIPWEERYRSVTTRGELDPLFKFVLTISKEDMPQP